MECGTDPNIIFFVHLFPHTAELYNTDRAKFDKTAQEYTKKVSRGQANQMLLAVWPTRLILFPSDHTF